MPHFSRQAQWLKPAQGNMRLWGHGRSITPWTHQRLGWRNTGQQTPSANRDMQPAKPCCPSLAASLNKTQFCVLPDMADSSPGVVDAQISSGFTLLSTLGKKMDGPRVPHRSFPLANPVPPCAVCTTEPCCIRDQYGNPGTAAGTLPAGHIQPCTAKVSTLLMGEKK